MVNSEIERGLYKAYRIDGQRVGLQWVYNEQKTNDERRNNEPKAKESYLNIEY